MLRRQALRGIKTWVQYRAEKLGKTEAEVIEFRKAAKAGAFETWKHQNETWNRLKFVLDHCNAEEQKFYLKEFSTEDLARFLLAETKNLSESDLEKIYRMPIKGHALPGLNTLYWLKRKWSIGLIVSEKNLSVEQKSRKIVRYLLEEKLEELRWRQLDQEISSRAVAL